MSITQLIIIIVNTIVTRVNTFTDTAFDTNLKDLTKSEVNMKLKNCRFEGSLTNTYNS